MPMPTSITSSWVQQSSGGHLHFLGLWISRNMTNPVWRKTRIKQPALHKSNLNFTFRQTRFFIFREIQFPLHFLCHLSLNGHLRICWQSNMIFLMEVKRWPFTAINSVLEAETESRNLWCVCAFIHNRRIDFFVFSETFQCQNTFADFVVDGTARTAE
jgi:hypothetical protein